MKTIDITYTVSFGKCDEGEGELSINVSDNDYKWIQIVRKITDEIDSQKIKNAIKDIKKEIKRIQSFDKNEKFKTQLDLINDDDSVSKEELLSVDWNSIDAEAFVDMVSDEIYKYEENCYKELYDYGEDDEDYSDEDMDDDSDEEYGDDNEYPGVITGIYW